MILDSKINLAKKIILDSSKKWPSDKIAIAWTGGKDSTVVLHLVRKVFNGKIPFKIFFNDSTLEFPEIYDFIKKMTSSWKLDLIWQKHLPKDLTYYKKAKNNKEKMEIMRIAKINAINFAVDKYKIGAFLSGIRWDEHEARSKETYFSKRPNHIRIHPILNFTIDDVWNYIKTYKVPYVSLYDKGYKSLGEAPFTRPVKNKKASERSGRETTKEKSMERLRSLGYW